MRARVWITIAILVLAGAGGLLWLSSSILFLRALTPHTSGSYTAFIGSTNQAAIEPFTQRVRTFFMSDVAQSISQALNKWVYRKDSNNAEAITAYGAGNAKNITAPLWHVEDFGLGVGTIFSSQGTTNPGLSTQSFSSVVGFITDSVLGRLPFSHPSIVIDVPGEPGPIAVSGKVQKNTFSFVYSQEEPLDKLQPQKIQPPSNLETMFVALPSAFLAHIPVDIQEKLQDTVKVNLSLTKSRPDIINSLQQAKAFTYLEGEFEGQAALGVIEDTGTSFMQAVKGWIALERGYLSPVTQAFRLPDGTIGHEYIPSPTVGDGFSQPGLDACSISYIDGKPMWLCHAGNVSVLGTSAELGYRGMKTLQRMQDDAHWQVSLPSPYASDLIQTILGASDNEQSHVNHLWIEGNNTHGNVVITFD